MLDGCSNQAIGIQESCRALETQACDTVGSEACYGRHIVVGSRHNSLCPTKLNTPRYSGCNFPAIRNQHAPEHVVLSLLASASRAAEPSTGLSVAVSLEGWFQLRECKANGGHENAGERA